MIADGTIIRHAMLAAPSTETNGRCRSIVLSPTGITLKMEIGEQRFPMGSAELNEPRSVIDFHLVGNSEVAYEG